jgi:hypothetical protein
MVFVLLRWYCFANFLHPLARFDGVCVCVCVMVLFREFLRPLARFDGVCVCVCVVVSFREFCICWRGLMVFVFVWWYCFAIFLRLLARFDGVCVCVMVLFRDFLRPLARIWCISYFKS